MIASGRLSLWVVLLVYLSQSCYHCYVTAASSSHFRPEIIGGIERSAQHALEDLNMCFPLVDPDAKITTDLMGTKQMMQALVANEIDFGVTIAALPSDIAVSSSTLRMFPLVVSGLSIIYRLDALSPTAPPIIISTHQLALIYSGYITHWSELADSNPTVTLPNTTITIVLEEGSNPKYVFMKLAFNKFNPNTRGQAVDDQDNWPYERYARYIKVLPINTNLVSKVISTDGSLAISYHAIAHTAGATVARMINYAGNTVSLTTDSLTLAALELGTSYTDSTTTVDLMDSHNPQGYPMVIFSSVIIDTSNSRNTCRSRELLVKYLLQFYQSSIFAAMLVDRSYVRVPDVIQQRMGIIEILKGTIMCRGGTALPMSVSTTRSIGSSKQHSFLTRLMSTVYSSVSTTTRFVPEILDDTLLTDMLMTSELDVAVVNPANVDVIKCVDLINSGNFLILPLFGHALNYFINPVLGSSPYVSLSSSETIAITPQPFVLTFEMTALMSLGCVPNFSDMANLNPWITSLIGNATLPIRFVTACGDDAPIGTTLNRVIQQKAREDPVALQEINRCMSTPIAKTISDGYVSCTLPATVPWQLVKSQDTIVPVTLGTPGAMGPTMVDNRVDGVWPQFMTKSSNGTAVFVKSTVESILACASDTYDPSTKWFDFTLSKNPNCWPVSQLTALIVRKQYWSSPTVTNSSSCLHGIDSLRFAKWLVTTDALDSVADADHAARLITANSRIRGDYIAALEAALCDNDTLLITLPSTWQLSSALLGFGAAISVLGMVWTVVSMLFVVQYRKHAAVRSASPIFVLTSLVGVMMMFGSVPALFLPVSNGTCAAVMWLFSIGFTLAFSPLFGKAFRIWRIFGGRKLQVIKISNRKLMVIIGFLVVAEIIAVGAWQAISPLQPITHITMEGLPSREHVYTQCSTTGGGDVFFIVLALCKGILLLCGSLLSFATRKVTSQFNESSQIAFTIWNFVFTIGIVCIIFIIINPHGDVATALLFLVAAWCSFFTGSMLVVPKMLHIYSGTEENDVTQTHASTIHGSVSGFSFLSLDMFSSLQMIGSYANALRRHLEAVDVKHAAMKRSNTPTTMVSAPHIRPSKVQVAGSSSRALSPAPQSITKRNQL